VTEVTGLSDYNVKITPVKAGKKIVGVTLHWGAKSEEEIKAAFKELRTSRVGRLARLTGQVETVVAETARVPATKRVQLVEAPPEPEKPTEQDRERGMKAKAKRMYPGLDVEVVYSYFNRDIAMGRHPEPKNREAAFIAYVKKRAPDIGVSRSR
jgi:hypothetical protein